jgi:hypothetical protein
MRGAGRARLWAPPATSRRTYQATLAITILAGHALTTGPEGG